jgi:hypothetical protein
MEHDELAWRPKAMREDAADASDSLQEAAEFVKSLEGVLEQFARAMVHISNGYTLPEGFQVLAVSHGPRSDINDPWRALQCCPADAPAEVVVSRAPSWASQVPAPKCWRLSSAQVQINTGGCPCLFIS